MINQRHNSNLLIAIWLWFALNGLDVILSHLCITLGALEVNPLIGTVSHMYGEFAGYGLKLVLTFFIVLFILKIDREYLFKWLNLGMFLVILFNSATLTYCLLA